MENMGGSKRQFAKLMKSYRLKIHPFAESELKEAEEWYNIQKEDLGKEFIVEIEKTLTQITHNPKQFVKIRKDVRKAVLKRFPFSIVYSVVDDTIELYSFLHHSRNPKIWQVRTK